MGIYRTPDRTPADLEKRLTPILDDEFPGGDSAAARLVIASRATTAANRPWSTSLSALSGQRDQRGFGGHAARRGVAHEVGQELRGQARCPAGMTGMRIGAPAAGPSVLRARVRPPWHDSIPRTTS